MYSAIKLFVYYRRNRDVHINVNDVSVIARHSTR